MKDQAPKKRYRGLKAAGWTILALFALVFIILQVALNSSFLTRVITGLTDRYVDGKVSFSRVEASLLRSFPYLSVSLDDVSLTYPHDRFSAYDSLGVRSHLREAGRAEAADTLAALKAFRLRVNVPAAIRGDIRIHNASLDGARIFAHRYDSLTANWNVLRTEPDPDKDTTAFRLPPIVVRSFTLSGRPSVVFTDPADTLFAGIRMKSLAFRGKLSTTQRERHRLGLDIDSLFAAGRLPADTLAVGLDFLRIHERRSHFDVSAAAKAFLALRSLGRLQVPLGLDARVSFPSESFDSVSVRNLRLTAAMLTLQGEADLNMQGDSTFIRAEAAIDPCRVADITAWIGDVVPALKKLHTDAQVSLDARCEGFLIPDRKILPPLEAELRIPSSAVRYEGFDRQGKLEARLLARTDSWGNLAVEAQPLRADLQGLFLDGTATVEDLLGEDPLIGLDARVHASLDTLSRFLPDSLGITASGDIRADLSGYALLSDLDLYNFARADLDGTLSSDGITLRDRPDSLYAYLDKTTIRLAPTAEKLDKAFTLGSDILALQADIDSLYATWGRSIFFRGSRIGLTAQNAAATRSEAFGNEYHPVVARLKADRLAMSGSDSLFIGIRNTVNHVKYSNRKSGKTVSPLLTATSRNGSLFLRQGTTRVGLRDAGISLTAVQAAHERVRRREATLDSLQALWPDVPRDSLMRKMMRERMAARGAAARGSDDFRDKDIRLDFGETVAGYFRDWNLNGSLDISRGLVITPYFPLRNEVSGVRGTFDNDAIRLTGLTVKSGESDLSATGKLTGLRRAIGMGSRGRSRLNLNLALTSEHLNANELLTAYHTGSRYVPPRSDVALDEGISDAEYLSCITDQAQAEPADSTLSLLVLPANLTANLSLQANEILYSDLLVSWLAADLAMRDRCLQITNTLATSNMGDIYFEGFYATRSKEDIKAGFDLNLVDITADKVITLFPAVDSLVPMLKSFKGMLDCELAATSDLDTNMNLVTPSINGIMKIKGSDLSLEENGALRKLARVLMFKDKKVGRIDDMSVEGLVTNNTLEVFPFVLKVDRYTLAMSGIQHFDQRFNYHISVLRSPAPLRFGINLSGNFDDWKFKVGKARYKNTRVPVFTAVIDTLQFNLIKSIHEIFDRGVELAIRQNQAAGQAIEQRKADIGYSTDFQMDSLSAAELHQLDSLQGLDENLTSRLDALTGTATPSGDAQSGEETRTDEPAAPAADAPAALSRKEARAARREERKARREARRNPAVGDDSGGAEADAADTPAGGAPEGTPPDPQETAGQTG